MVTKDILFIRGTVIAFMNFLGADVVTRMCEHARNVNSLYFLEDVYATIILKRAILI